MRKRRKQLLSEGVDTIQQIPPETTNFEAPQAPVEQQIPQYHQPTLQIQQPLGYNQNDKPIAGEEDKKFVKNELSRLKLKYLIGLLFSTSILIVIGFLMAFFIVDNYSFTFDSTITGYEHLIWMSIVSLLSLSIFWSFAMKYYISKKDKQRQRAIHQFDSYVPLTLKKYYRALKANNTFIHYFTTLSYITLGVTIGVLYLLDPVNKIGGELTTISSLSGLSDTYAIYLGATAAVILALHITWILLRKRKTTMYDGRFGYEIVPMEEVLAQRKSNRRICLIITLVLLIIGSIVYILIKKFWPNTKFGNLLRK